MQGNVSTPRPALLGLVALGITTTACVRPEGAHATLGGKELFAACVSCHGQQGEGNVTVAAPPIAGLPVWYVEAQLNKFRSDARGAHPDDAEGLRMRPMSRQLMNPAEIASVASHVAALPRAPSAPALTGGNAASGAAAYATCSACHGPTGQGNQALGAPPLAGQADWYMLTQLKKFKAGIRGANPKDASGATMRPMALTLANDQAMHDVLAHIATLAK